MLRTQRLTLEPVAERHLDDLIEAIKASLTELRPWMMWAVRWDPEESKTYLLSRKDNDHLMAIVQDGKAIGACNVLVSKPLFAWGELGYWISSAASGKGLMTEALDEFISWAFDDLGLHRVELRAGVDNTSSNRIAEKLGFRNCGVVRESAAGAGGFYDCNLWELVAGDPRPPVEPKPAS